MFQLIYMNFYTPAGGRLCAPQVHVVLEIHELATGIQAPAGTCKLINIALRTNCIKYQMLHVILI